MKHEKGCCLNSFCNISEGFIHKYKQIHFHLQIDMDMKKVVIILVIDLVRTLFTIKSEDYLQPLKSPAIRMLLTNVS